MTSESTDHYDKGHVSNQFTYRRVIAYVIRITQTTTLRDEMYHCKEIDRWGDWMPQGCEYGP